MSKHTSITIQLQGFGQITFPSLCLFVLSKRTNYRRLAGMYLAYSVLGTTFLHQYYRMVTLSPYGTILEK